jgi:hypothetical protein
MQRIVRLSTCLAVLIGALLPAAPAQALNQKSFVRSDGSGAACTRAAPCANFQAAHDATSAGGEINCLDSGPDAAGFFTAFFGSAFISKSITIDCAGVPATAFGLIVNGAGIVVKIRNLTISGAFAETGFGGFFTGVGFTNGAALIVEHCVVENFSASGFGSIPAGLVFQPSAAGSQLVVSDTVLNNNGTGSTGAGIIVEPTGSGSAFVTLDRVRMTNNVTGVLLYATPGGTVRATITDSTIAGNAFTGLYALSTGGQLTAAIKRATVVNNGGTGVYVQGSNAFVTVSNAAITGNAVGWNFVGGGNLISYVNNEVSLNVSANGVPSASLAPQ